MHQNSAVKISKQMLTYNELIELRDKLVNGEIQLEFAKAQYWNDSKEGQRSWYTKDWKERRLKFIKDKCEICNSTETLTIQHHSHPRKYSDYLREITRGYTKDYIDINQEISKSDFTDYVQKRYDYDPVPLCSNCNNKNPSVKVRKTSNIAAQIVSTNLMKQFSDRQMNSFLFFLKMKMHTKFKTNALFQRINGKIRTIYLISDIGYKVDILEKLTRTGHTAPPIIWFWPVDLEGLTILPFFS